MENRVLAVKIAFGKRIQQFRKAAGLTQIDFAEFMSTGKAYISELENGTANPSLEMQIRYAEFYGVEFYQLANPEFPVPTFEQLPAATHRAIRALKKRQQKAKEKAEELKAANREEGVPGRAKRLHVLFAAGFFKKPRTAKDAFLKLNSGISKKELGEYATEIGRITVTLGQGRFAKLLDKLNPAQGSNAVRFVEKAADSVGYADSRGGKSMAADKK